MTQDEVNKLRAGDAVSLVAAGGSCFQRSFRGRVDMVTESYIRVSWPAADEYRGDILMRTSPVWEAMVKRP